MLSFWWDFKGIVYFELLPRNQTINSNVYCCQLMKLDKEIKEKRTELAIRKGVIFHQHREKNLRFHCYHFGPRTQTSLSFQIQDENSINDSHANHMNGGQATRVYQ